MRSKSKSSSLISMVVIGGLIMLTLPNNVVTKAITVITEPICLSNSTNNEYKKIVCEKETGGVIFVSQVRYSDEIREECISKENQLQQTTTRKSWPTTRCSAFTTEKSASVCNGRTECGVKLVPIWFDYGRSGSNCAFWARVLSITYECIPNRLDDLSIERTNICEQRLIQHPVQGFIYSPNYPNAYNPTSYCQLTLRRPLPTDRIEIFLIDLQTEEVSKRTYSPTDYLQINNREILFGEKQHLTIFNESSDAIITFKTDLFFNKRGFLLFYRVVNQVVNQIIPIESDVDSTDFDVVEVEEETTTKTTTTTTTTTTTEAENTTEPILSNSTNIEANETLSTTTVSIIITKLSSSNSKLSRDEEHIEKKLTAITDHTFKAILILIAIILLLTGVIMFMVLKNRKSLCGHSAIYKAALNPHANRSANIPLYDQSLVNQYLDTSMALIGANASALLNASSSSNPNDPTLVGGYVHPFIYNKRMSADESVAQLLLLAAATAAKRSSAQLQQQQQTNLNPNQVYDDISEAFNISKAKETTQTNNAASKVNEYCYIPASGLSNAYNASTNNEYDDEGGFQSVTSKPIQIPKKSVLRGGEKRPLDPNKPVCSSWLSSGEDEPDTEETSHSSRSSPTDSSRVAILQQTTSTPCPPKSQPPTRVTENNKTNEETLVSNDYKQCEQTQTPTLADFINETGMTIISSSSSSSDVNEEMKTLCPKNKDNKLNMNDEEIYDTEYQIPSNLVLNASTSL